MTSTTTAMPLAGRRETVAGCVAAVRDLHTVLYQCPSGELGRLAGELAELRALCGAQLAATAAEAETRGVVAESQHATTSGWVGDHAWHSRRESVTIAKTARILQRRDLEAVTESVMTVDIDPGTAIAVAAEYDTLAPDLIPEARSFVLDRFLTVAAQDGPAGVRRLREEILARYADTGEFEHHQDQCRRLVDLSAGKETSPGVWQYGLTADNEGRGVIEAAIGPLSAPRPDKTTGEPDLRPVGRRRGEALIEALRRSVSAAKHVPTSPKAVLMVTMTLDQLTGRLGPAGTSTGCPPDGTDLDATRSCNTGGSTSGGDAPVNAGVVIGSRAAGTLLAPDTIRKLACDAAIIPVVLGSRGEILDQGRQQRLFTPAQIKAPTLRDGGCTFDGCAAPAAWCSAHHLIHWIDGGPTDLDNATLLCGRHHTIVHRDRLAGTLTPHGITWDRRPGSYQPPPRPPDIIRRT